MALDLGAVKLATVCGFRKAHGFRPAFEAAQSVANADEVDMVIDVGRLIAGDAAHTEREIRAVRDAMDAEASAAFSRSSSSPPRSQTIRIVVACVAAEDAADFVKTSTGFHPAGGASEHAIALMARTAGSRLGVKASGGIRSWEAAQTMADAGANGSGCRAPERFPTGQPPPETTEVLVTIRNSAPRARPGAPTPRAPVVGRTRSRVSRTGREPFGGPPTADHAKCLVGRGPYAGLGSPGTTR